MSHPLSNVNKVILVGNLGNTPELRKTNNGNVVANLSIATSRRVKTESGKYEPATEWHRAVVWGKRAENCVAHLKKGNRVYLEGAIQLKSWQDKEGNKRETPEILVEDIRFLGFKKEEEETQLAQ